MALFVAFPEAPVGAQIPVARGTRSASRSIGDRIELRQPSPLRVVDMLISRLNPSDPASSSSLRKPFSCL